MDTTTTTSAPLTPTEAAARLGLSTPTIYRMLAAGQLPAVKRHGRWAIDERDLEHKTAA